MFRERLAPIHPGENVGLKGERLSGLKRVYEVSRDYREIIAGLKKLLKLTEHFVGSIS